MELVGQIVASFYDICSEIWRRVWATESLKSGIENTSGGIKAEENGQPKELSNVPMALVMTIMKVKASTTRKTAKYWVGYQ